MILIKFAKHATDKQFSEKFNNGCKKIKMTDLLWFLAIYVNNFTSWVRKFQVQ